MQFKVQTSALSGTISSQHFGQKFDPDKVEPLIYYDFRLTTPSNAVNNKNLTLHIDIEYLKITEFACYEGSQCQSVDKLIMDDSKKLGDLDVFMIRVCSQSVQAASSNLLLTPPEAFSGPQLIVSIGISSAEELERRLKANSACRKLL